MTRTKFIISAVAPMALLSLLMTVCGGCGRKGGKPGDFIYKLNEEGNGIVITDYAGAGGKVIIPAMIDNLPVVEIGENAFRGSGGEVDNPRAGDGITSVVIPIGVIKIDRGAFADCRSLISVTMPDTVEEIREVAFRGCTSLVSVNLPAKLKLMGINAFFSDRELRNLSIPDGMTAIKWQGWNHFSGCGKLPDDTRKRLRELGYPAGF